MLRPSFTLGRLFPILLVAATFGSVSVALRGIHAANSPEGDLPIGAAKPVDLPALKNVVRLSATLYTGAAPEGDAGFRALHRLGIKTIITVDGAPPEVERARRYGMRYVHLPFGYDGCPLPTANVIVKAVRDLHGPIYVHCHHGKHRAPRSPRSSPASPWTVSPTSRQ